MKDSYTILLNQFFKLSSNFSFQHFITIIYSFWKKIQIVCTKKICLAAFHGSFKALSNGEQFSYGFTMISLEEVKINRSILFSSFFAYFLLYMDMNIFTLLALKSKRIELLRSAWWHFEDFFLLFLMITDFNLFFTVVWSQISHKGDIFEQDGILGSFLNGTRIIWHAPHRS